MNGESSRKVINAYDLPNIRSSLTMSFWLKVDSSIGDNKENSNIIKIGSNRNRLFDLSLLPNNKNLGIFVKTGNE